MFNSYLQLELRRKNIWHAGHHKTIANFKSVTNAHKHSRPKYSNFVANMIAWQLHYCKNYMDLTAINFASYDFWQLSLWKNGCCSIFCKPATLMVFRRSYKYQLCPSSGICNKYIKCVVMQLYIATMKHETDDKIMG